MDKEEKEQQQAPGEEQTGSQSGTSGNQEKGTPSGQTFGDKTAGFFDRAWDFLASVKLAIIVFSLIALTSIVGTILEQNAPAQTNIKILREMIGDSLAGPVYNALDAMGFVDMYHSWWFLAILMLFAVNLLICSLDRLPRIWKLVTDKQSALKDEQFKAFPIKREFIVTGSQEEIQKKLLRQALSTSLLKWISLGVLVIALLIWPFIVTTTALAWSAVALLILPVFFLELLATIRMRVNEHTEGDGIQFSAQHGQHSRLGVYITHISILLIMIGALVGFWFGFNGTMRISEGQATFIASDPPILPQHYDEYDRIYEALIKNQGDMQRTATSFGVTLEHLNNRMKKIGIHNLGFIIKCKDFEVDFYGMSDMPKEYRSNLSVYEGDQEVQDLWIEVNKPLRHKGYTFYQSNYGPVNNINNIVYRFSVSSRNNPSDEQLVEVRRGESFTLPGSEMTARVADHSPSLAFDQNSGQPYTYNEMMNNPAVRLELMEGEKTVTSRWVLKRRSDSWYLDTHVIKLLDIWGAQFTGLQVRKDPGVWIVYYGCSLIGVGLYMAFFMSHRRVWIKLAPTGGKGSGKRVMLAASANKNRESFERLIDKVVSHIADGGK